MRKLNEVFVTVWVADGEMKSAKKLTGILAINSTNQTALPILVGNSSNITAAMGGCWEGCDVAGCQEICCNDMFEECTTFLEF